VADLYDVGYPLRSAISGTVDGLTIGRAELRLTVPATDLGSVLGVPNLTLSSTGGTGIRLHTSVTVAGETVPVTADVAISMTDRTLHLSASALSAGGVSLPSALIGELHRRLTVSVSLPGLPFGVTSAVISVSGGHLEVAGAQSRLDVVRPGADDGLPMFAVGVKHPADVARFDVCPVGGFRDGDGNSETTLLTVTPHRWRAMAAWA
jgi:hypothetical protein